MVLSARSGVELFIIENAIAAVRRFSRVDDDFVISSISYEATESPVDDDFVISSISSQVTV